MSTHAKRLQANLIELTWVSIDHAKNLGYEKEIEELVAAGLATKQMLSGTPVLVISSRMS